MAPDTMDLLGVLGAFIERKAWYTAQGHQLRIADDAVEGSAQLATESGEERRYRLGCLLGSTHREPKMHLGVLPSQNIQIDRQSTLDQFLVTGLERPTDIRLGAVADDEGMAGRPVVGPQNEGQVKNA